MNTENTGPRPLRERLKRTLAGLQADSVPADERLNVTGSIAEWRALEALVSAGEERESDRLLAAAIAKGMPPEHPRTWGYGRARMFADPLVAHIAGAILARMNSGQVPAHGVKMDGTLFEWSALLRLVEIAGESQTTPAPASTTAVPTSAQCPPALLAAAIRNVAGMKEMHPASRSMLEMIAGQVAALPTVTITHHSNT